MKTNSLCLLAAAFSALVLSGCATESSGNVYRADQAQREQTVRTGTVEGVREVTIQKDETGVGTIGGGVVGGIAGSTLGQGRGSAVGAVVGAIAGGLAGHVIEGNVDKTKGLEITVKLDNGESRAIVQTADEPFAPGDRVRILSQGGVSRVTH